MDLAEWESRYRAQPAAALEATPSPLLVATAEAMPPGRALDLACGSGRHALWLAARRWQVTAVDGAPAAISLLLSEAARREVTLDARVADLEKFEFPIEPNAYQLIASLYYFERNLLPAMRAGVSPGGAVIVIALQADPERPNSRFRTSPGELRSYFEGWEILHDREGPDASGHRVAEIAARRPVT